jgi:hypothetical protein
MAHQFSQVFDKELEFVPDDVIPVLRNAVLDDKVALQHRWRGCRRSISRSAAIDSPVLHFDVLIDDDVRNQWRRKCTSEVLQISLLDGMAFHIHFNVVEADAVAVEQDRSGRLALFRPGLEVLDHHGLALQDRAVRTPRERSVGLGWLEE